MFQAFKLNGIEYIGQELTSGQAIKIAKYGDNRNEDAIGALITSAFKRTDSNPIDTLKMTAAQRYFFVAAYLMQDGLGGEFAPHLYNVGNGVLLDYIQDYKDGDFENMRSETFELHGQEFYFYPLLGWHADIVERTVRRIKSDESDLAYGIESDILYELACISVQMFVEGEANIPINHDKTQEACQVVHHRVHAMLAHKESDFSTMLSMYYGSNFDDIFKFGFCDDGICILPREQGAGFNPVMFRAVSCLTEISARMG